MKIGIPKGLLYHNYYPFLNTFFNELGAEIITSEDTNKQILNEGVKYCVDEACLPIKIFHGHIASIKDKCDVILIPRVMQLKEKEYICPKFCGLPEMVLNNIPNMPRAIIEPIYATSRDKLYAWAKIAGKIITNDKHKIKTALNKALIEQSKYKTGIADESYKINIALLGHPYNIYDNFINMNLVKRLNKLGAGVITEEYITEEIINGEVKDLYKRPFWTFGKNSYGFASYAASKKMVKGMIYISSFACGIDSVMIELVKDKIGDFPLMVLKIDEQTGEAGLDTRLEAFFDMLERSSNNESDISTYGQYLPSSKGII
jgi:predicted nucleotide-binding protein (sugar kinase/HSP70/actin superfamily)